MQKNAAIQLSEYLAEQGLKSTGQRDKILKIFVEAGRHLSAEELYGLVKSAHTGISYVTVYRTLKLLADAGLAEERRFEGGVTSYEYKSPKSSHHDHLICTGCGKIIEFKNDRIEALQQEVARENDFHVRTHKLEIYGLCASCHKKKK